MASGIGATLRKARNRRKLSLSEVEAAIKIRARYLRAIEAEEWDALPGGSYDRAFVRTYATLLGLDGDRLAREAGEGEAPPGPQPSADLARGRSRRGGPRLARGPALSVAVVVAVAAVLLAVGLLTGGKGGEPAPAPRNSPAAGGGAGGESRTRAEPARRGVELSLATTGEVWVCVVGSDGSRLVDGVVLPAGATEGPFRSDSFTVSLGNGEVKMLIDGEDAKVPESSSPLGYSISPGGKLEELSEAERPTCL